MSSMFNDHHPKREPNDHSGAGVGMVYTPSPPPPPNSILKVNKSSHAIKKPPSPSSSSSAASKPRQPVIIYTNTPKIIHTNPNDFMALVQKLTGMSRSVEDSGGNTITDPGGNSNSPSVSNLTVDRKINRNRCGGGHNSYNISYSGAGAGRETCYQNAMICDDSESSSVVTTDENIGEHGQVNSCLPYSSVAIPPPPPPPPQQPQLMYDATGTNYGAYLSTFSMLPAVNPADSFLCGNQPYANFDDPLYFAPNMRSSFSSSSSSSGFDGLTEFRDF